MGTEISRRNRAIHAPGKPVEILPQVLTPSRLVSMVS
jgi:hypothetical protein